MTNKEAIDVLKANYPDSCYELLREAVDMAIEALEQPERKKGKWIDLGRVYECSVCHERSCCAGNYCPDCGAEMEKEA